MPPEASAGLRDRTTEEPMHADPTLDPSTPHPGPSLRPRSGLAQDEIVDRATSRAGGITMKRMAPELVLASHFAFVLFAVFGGLLAFADLRWAWLHVPAVVWSAVVNLRGWTCPLTPLEQELRRRASIEGYEGGFVAHYIAPLVYPAGMPRRLELTAAVSITVWNALVYGALALVRG